jgi:hypothetical protein
MVAMVPGPDPAPVVPPVLVVFPVEVQVPHQVLVVVAIMGLELTLAILVLLDQMVATVIPVPERLVVTPVMLALMEILGLQAVADPAPMVIPVLPVILVTAVQVVIQAIQAIQVTTDLVVIPEVLQRLPL